MSLTIKLRITPTATHFNPNRRTHKNPSISLKPTYRSNPFSTSLVLRSRKMASTVVVKISLIDPNGCVLVDLIALESQRNLKASEAEKMVKVKLTKIDLEWVHVISEGWVSPLKGFMREDEYLQSLHFNSLRMKDDGSIVNMSLPIVLDIDDETKERIWRG